MINPAGMLLEKFQVDLDSVVTQCIKGSLHVKTFKCT